MMDQKFESLNEEILKCTKCGLSHPHAGIFIIGEAPGREEDMIGKPFVGKSGVLLERILYVCGFSREEHVFISNIVRCRPPDNRPPTPQEAAACVPWLLKQIEMVDPKIIILLGATALKHMVGPDYRITHDHGTWLTCKNKLAMPVYHPAALLRNPQLKQDTWEDFKKIVYKYRELIDPHHYTPYIK